jgi:pantoate--beta-alanine ligase
MVRDLDFGIEIVAQPIIREADGLAMSSRNSYLTPQARQIALGLSRGLAAAEALVRSGERDGAKLLAAAQAQLTGTRIDYVELRDATELSTVTSLEAPAVLAIAAFVGPTRLIDNRVLTP